MTYSENKKKIKFIILTLFVFLIIILIGSTTIGIVKIDFIDSIKILLSKIPIINNYVNTDNIPTSSIMIVTNLRAPRIIMAAIIGAGLSVAGASFQSMFNNPMADPYLIGISSGASLGATIGIAFGLQATMFGLGLISFLSFAGAVVTTLVVYLMARTNTRVNSVTLLLSGVAVSFLLNSIITIIMVFKRDRIEMITMWMMGSVATVNWTQVSIAVPAITICILVIYSFARELNILTIGDDTSKNLGIDIELIKKVLLVLNSIIVGTSTAFGGIIGFVGLIVPHAVRIMFGSDNRNLIPLSALCGAIFLAFSDTLARNALPIITGSPSELPVGAITALFGAPFFISLIIKSKKVD